MSASPSRPRSPRSYNTPTGGATASPTPAMRDSTKPRDSIASVQSAKSTFGKDGQRALTAEKLQLTLRDRPCTRPRGMVAVHLKKLTLETLDMYKLFKKYNATMYIRMTCQGQIKCTTAYHNIGCPSTTLFDEIKHFRVRVSEKRMEPINYFRMELVACTPGEKVHRVLCIKDIHLYDIIKNLFCVDPIPLRNEDKQIGEMDVEMCFAYGTFGYGYSSQFYNRKKTTQEQVAHSMFCFAEPPEGREDFTTDVMTCSHIGHPTFIQFKKKVDIGVSKFSEDLAFYPELQMSQQKKPRLLLSKIRKNVHHMQKEYGSQPNRRERLEYLHRMVSQPGQFTELDTQHFEVHDNYKLRYSKPLGNSDSKSKLVNQLNTTMEMGQLLQHKNSRQRKTPMPPELPEDSQHKMGTASRLAELVTGWWVKDEKPKSGPKKADNLSHDDLHETLLNTEMRPSQTIEEETRVKVP